MTAVQTDKSAPVSAIVVSYFTGPVLERCLASLRSQSEISEIILVDNGNPPGAIEAAISRLRAGAGIKLLSGHGNIGFAAACNKGVDEASGEYILFFNPDAVMPGGGVTTLLSGIERGPQMIGARLVNADGAEQQGGRRNRLTPKTAFFEASQFYRLLPNKQANRFNWHQAPLPDQIADVPTISGACMLLKKADYLAIGGMDEDYFLHVEDVDFCKRYADAGGRVLFHPAVNVRHFTSSSRVSSANVERLKTESLITYFRKHFSTDYPAPVWWAFSALLRLAHIARMSARSVKQSVRYIGFMLRNGRGAAVRAKSIYRARSTR